MGHAWTASARTPARAARPLALAVLLSSCIGAVGLPGGTPPGDGPGMTGGGAGGGAPRTGVGGGGNPSGVGGAPATGVPVAPFACDATARPPLATLRRLTMTQYQNTL